MSVEILAPAGSIESVYAAVRNGADAVYFGTDNFNARRNAANFDGDELDKAVRFCHLHGVKCHIALNTLVGDNELNEIIKTIKRTCAVGADALILQDLGVARLVRAICPEMEMHASTQLSTGTLAGLKLLKELGFSRAVLPRELSLGEIKKIACESPLELEMFVHGALCMCVSGQCLFSAMLGSRSGNRGLCAQPCRLPFSVENGTGHDLSLKDLSLVEEINELSSLGIKSFKIEGRMKRPEYVAAAVRACRESVDGIYHINDRNELKSLFSRSGFTRGYYESNLGSEMFGKREKEDVTSATKELLKKYASTYEKEKAIYKTDFVFSAYIGEKPTLAASADGFNVFAEADKICEKAINRPLDRDSVEAQLDKCGGTVFYKGETECDLDEQVSVPVSVINSLRREVLSALEEKISEPREYKTNDVSLSHKDRQLGKRKKYLCFSDLSQLPDNIDCDRVFIPLGSERKTIEKYNAGVCIPRGIFGNYEVITDKIKKSGAKYALCNTLDAVAAAREAGVEPVGGPFLNVFNSVSLEALKDLSLRETVLSYELTVQQISSLNGEIARGCVVYGRTPLMLTRNCPIKNGKTCAECGRSSCLTDRMGIEFPVMCENGFSQIYNSRPTYMADRLSEIRNSDFDMLVFTNETKEECAEVLTAFETGAKPSGEFTRGLFYRGVE